MVEKILRMKIYDSTYWKEHCFALTAEAVVDKAVDIKSLGGTYGGARKPSKFVCLLLKLLQLQPDKDIIIEFIKNEDYKYVRILGGHCAYLMCGSNKADCNMDPQVQSASSCSHVIPGNRFRVHNKLFQISLGF